MKVIDWDKLNIAMLNEIHSEEDLNNEIEDEELKIKDEASDYFNIKHHEPYFIRKDIIEVSVPKPEIHNAQDNLRLIRKEQIFSSQASYLFHVEKQLSSISESWESEIWYIKNLLLPRPYSKEKSFNPDITVWFH